MENNMVKKEGTNNVDRVNDEFTMYMRLAEELAKGGMFPNARTAAAAFSIIQYGKELGIPPVTALQNIYAVNGRLGISTQLFASKVEAAGVKSKIIKETDTEHVILFTRGTETYESRFTIEEAKQMGLVKDGGSWTRNPKDMLHWRCYARGARRIAPDLVMNLLVKDELEELEPQELKGKPFVEMPESIEPASAPVETGANKTTEQKKLELKYGEIHTGNARKDLQNELLNYAEGSVEQAKKVLWELTTWTNEKGDVVEGTETFASIKTEPQAGTILGKLREFKKNEMKERGIDLGKH